MRRNETENAYRASQAWDRVGRSTHCVDCYPGSCPYYEFVRDGKIVASEPIGAMAIVDPSLPDLNPMGCQKGASWHLLLKGQERVLHPLKRAGARGEGKWEQVSWDHALGEIADHLLDAIEEIGPDSIIHEGTPSEGGLLGMMPLSRVTSLLGATRTDVNGVINDNSPGTYLTYGKFDPVISVDDLYHAELVIYAHTNPGLHDDPDGAHCERGALPRHGDRARRARRQPIAHPRRLLRAGAARHRRGAGARHGAGDHR